MKKNLMSLLTLIGFVTIFAACSSDNNKDEKPKIEDEALVAQWNVDKSPLILELKPKEDVPADQYTIAVPDIPNVMEAQDVSLELIPMFGPVVITPKLKAVLKSVSFNDDLSITAEYMEDGNVKVSPKGLISYKVITKNELMQVQLDAKAIIKEAEITDELLVNIITQALKEPIQLKYNIEDDTLNCFIDMEIMTKLIPTIKAAIGNLELHEVILTEINNVIAQLPRIAEQTDIFKLGLSLVK